VTPSPVAAGGRSNCDAINGSSGDTTNRSVPTTNRVHQAIASLATELLVVMLVIACPANRSAFQ